MESAIVQHLNPEFEPVAVVWSNSIPDMRHLAVKRSWLQAANEWCKKTSSPEQLATHITTASTECRRSKNLS